MNSLNLPLGIAIRREQSDHHIAASDELDRARPIDFVVLGSGWKRQQLGRLVRCLLIKVEAMRGDLANAAARERELSRRLALHTATKGTTHD